jgi:hypothetical protein
VQGRCSPRGDSHGEVLTGMQSYGKLEWCPEQEKGYAPVETRTRGGDGGCADGDGGVMGCERWMRSKGVQRPVKQRRGMGGKHGEE